MSIQCIKSGMLTSIQDCGRTNVMQWGIAKTGAIDTLSMIFANRLISNPDNHPVLEVCLTGPTLIFTQAMSIAICGAEFTVTLVNNKGSQFIENNQNINISAGDKLIFGKRQQGARAYLAFAAQLSLPRTYDSYSTHFLAKFGGFHGRALKANDEIELTHCEVRKNHRVSDTTQLPPQYTGKYLLRCTSSVETELFSNEQIHDFYNTKYIVSPASNRMGLRLDGRALTNLSMPDLISSGLLTGSIQIPPNGLPIVSSVDGQTIGGYPRIANVITADQFTLGQLVAGDQVQFIKVDLAHAHHLLKEQKLWLDTLTP